MEQIGAHRVGHQHVSAIVIGLFLIIAVAVLLARCPWPACAYLNLNTYTIATLHEFRQFLSDEAAFKAFHRVAAVRLNCAALRDDVVEALQSGRLMLGLSQPDMAQKGTAKAGLLRAWRQGLVLHLTAMSDNEREQEIWAAMVQEMVVSQERDELSFLPRLFGGMIIHTDNKQKPMVLFSDERCL